MLHEPSALFFEQACPRIHVLSDVHLDSGEYVLPEGLEYDILVVAGDVGSLDIAVPWLAQLGKPVVYVLGNHEFWRQDLGEAVEYAKRLACGTQVVVLNRESVVIQDVVFLGATLWTSLGGLEPNVVSSVTTISRDYEFVRANAWLRQEDNAREFSALCAEHALWDSPNLDHDAAIRLHPGMVAIEHTRSVSWLEAQLRAHRQARDPRHLIVVTHHAPSQHSLLNSGTPAAHLRSEGWGPRNRDCARSWGYATPLLEKQFSSLARTASAWVHGHVHAALDYCVSGTRVLCNPRGKAIVAITPEIAASYALLGYPVSDEQISRSHQDAQSYLGEAQAFDRHLVIQLDDGYSRPLGRALAPGLKTVKELRGELSGLVPLLAPDEGLKGACVAECVAARIQKIREITHWACAFLAETWGVDDAPVTFALEGLRPPYLADITVHSSGPDRAALLESLRAVEAWLEQLPSLIERVKAHRALAVQAILSEMREKGFPVIEVPLPSQSAQRFKSLNWIQLRADFGAVDMEGAMSALSEIEALQPVPRPWLMQLLEE